MKNDFQKIETGLFAVFLLFISTIIAWSYSFPLELDEKFFIGLLIPTIINLIVDIRGYDNFLFLIKTQLVNRNEQIRVTTAYIFKIKYNGKYLLIKNKKKYFPIGGKFKFYETAFAEWGKLKINIKDDYLFKETEQRNNDLAKVIDKKDIPMFFTWFKSRKDREICVWREFYDEVVKTKIFPLDLFPFVDCKFISTNPLEITINHHNKPELKIHEVYELVLNEVQSQFLKTLFENPNDEIYWATSKEIDNLQADNSEIEFANHTPFLLLN